MMTRYATWPVKIAYVCLVLWVTVISPLIYFGDYSSHQGVGGFQFSVWQTSNQAHKLNQALAQVAAQTQPEQPTAEFWRGGPTITAVHRSVVLHGQSLTRYHDYLIATIVISVLFLSLLFRYALTHISGGKFILPPPEHPPSFLLGF